MVSFVVANYLFAYLRVVDFASLSVILVALDFFSPAAVSAVAGVPALEVMLLRPFPWPLFCPLSSFPTCAALGRSLS